MDFVTLEEGYFRMNKNNNIKIIKMQDENQKQYFVPGFASINEYNAVYAIYVENNIEWAKNCYYEAAMAIAYCKEKLNRDAFVVIKNILYPLMSDSNSIVSRFLQYNSSSDYEKAGSFSTHFGHAVQAVLKDDDQDLEHRIEWMTKRSKSGFFKKMTGVVTVFEGILDRDIPKIESGLKDIVKRLKKDQPLIIGNYMNIEATGLAKLAWRKGLEVDIKSTFIPQALLPIKELEHYGSYDFFKHQD